MISQELVFLYLYIVGSILALIYVNKKHEEQFDIDFDGLSKFVAFMVLVTMVRLCIFDTGLINVSKFHKFPLKMWSFMFVIFEDVFFVMIPYYLTRNSKSRVYKAIMWSCFSLVFATGHLYQGYFIAAITALYPYHVSRRFALKTSFATVMACHFIYDCITFITLKFTKILQYL